MAPLQGRAALIPPVDALDFATLLRGIFQHTRQAFPDEACGAWSLLQCGAYRHHPFVNRCPAKQRAEHFLVDLLDWLALLEADDRGELVLCGLYHSHPNAPARLSREDRAALLWQGVPIYPQLTLLIVSLAWPDPHYAILSWSQAERDYQTIERRSLPFERSR